MAKWMLAAGVVIGLPLTSTAQMHSGSSSAPLLYVRFASPAAARATLFQGPGQGKEFTAPVTVGLRPGYIYRVKIANLPDHTDAALFPTLEVRGTLQLPSNLRASNYPAPIVLSQEDIERALAGTLVTKVLYLEHPDHAVPAATRPDQPLETDVRALVDPVAEARLVGRPLVIIRFGGRTLTDAELAAEAIPGTVLLPGDKALGAPAARPYVPWAGCPVYDPYAGPRPPEEECLRDGGDAGLPAGLDREGRLHGLDPADTVAVYSDSKGGKHIAVSNPVHLCVPRFAVIRGFVTPIGYNARLAIGDTARVQGQIVMAARVPSLETKQNEQLAGLQTRERPSGTESTIGTIPVEQLQGNAFLIGRYGEQAITGVMVQKTHVPPDRPLVLQKWADKQAAQIGELVTFHLKYTNQGGQPITGIELSDSLTGRLEYVPGSAQSDRGAVFTMRDNEAGSLILHWEIGGALPPGQSGVVTFQARVR
jgi:uncharacterized repeat protein (TIGR01451 family)